MDNKVLILHKGKRYQLPVNYEIFNIYDSFDSNSETFLEKLLVDKNEVGWALLGDIMLALMDGYGALSEFHFSSPNDLEESLRSLKETYDELQYCVKRYTYKSWCVKLLFILQEALNRRLLEYINGISAEFINIIGCEKELISKACIEESVDIQSKSGYGAINIYLDFRHATLDIVFRPADYPEQKLLAVLEQITQKYNYSLEVNL